MKTRLLTILTVLLLTQTAFAQGFEGKGDAIFSIGASFGHGQYNYFRGYNERNILPPLSLMVELGVHDWFSVGPYFGFESRSFKGNIDLYEGQNPNYGPNGYWEWTERWITGGLRVNWYLTPFFNDKASTNIPEELHIYVGLLGGISHYAKPGYYYEWPYRGDYNYTETVPSGAASVGVRYMFTPGLGAFFEGYGGRYFRDGTIGISAKF